VSRVVAAPLTHVLLQPVASVVNQPVASVVNPTPTVCHSSTTADDVITDQWRRSLVIDTGDPYISMVSGITVFRIIVIIETWTRKTGLTPLTYMTGN